MTETPRVENTDGKLLATALMSVPSEILATSLALMRETHLLSVLWSRVKSLIRWSKDDFEKELAATTRRLAAQSRGSLALELLLELNRALEIKPRNYVARRDVEDNAGEVVAKSVEVLKGMDSDFKGSGLEDLVVHQAQKLVTGVGKRLAELPDDERRRVISQFREFIESLPAERQEAIKKSLGTDDLSDDIIRKALMTGAAATAFATVVEIAGFSAYTFATSSLATLAGAVGLTLPFGAYTGLTSMIAILASPWFILLALGGVVTFSVRHGQAKVQRGLIPPVITQLTTAGALADGPSDPDTAARELLVLWGEALDSCRAARRQVKQLEEQLASTEVELVQVKTQIATIQTERSGKGKDASTQTEALVELLTSKGEELASGAWHPELSTAGQEIVEARERLKSVRERPVRESFIGSLIDGIRKGRGEVSARSSIHEVAQRATEEVLRLAGEGFRPSQSDARRLVERILLLGRVMEELDRELAELGRTRDGLVDSCKTHSDELGRARTERAAAEGRYWGLEKVT